MPYCSNCGAKVIDGDKFCSVCGSSVSEKNKGATATSAERTTTYDGVIHKCPNCGEILNSFVINCPCCGYELRDKRATNSVKELEKELQEIEAQRLKENDSELKTAFNRLFGTDRSGYVDQQLANKISNFIIPNNQEDIFEFLILAASNINPMIYDGISNGNSKGQEKILISNAWDSKYLQAYQKAKILFPDDPRLSSIETLYKSKQKEVRNSKRKPLYIILGFLAFFVAIMCAVFIPHAVKEHNLEKQIDVIEELIENGDYDAALRNAEQLHGDANYSRENAKKWDEIREAYIIRIEELQAKAAGKIKIPQIDIKGKQYTEVEDYYKKAGFSNVFTEKVADLITGWLHDDGEVIDVYINGSNQFSVGEYIEQYAEIVIKYHGFAD